MDYYCPNCQVSVDEVFGDEGYCPSCMGSIVYKRTHMPGWIIVLIMLMIFGVAFFVVPELKDLWR